MTKFLFLCNCAFFGLNAGAFIATGSMFALLIAAANGYAAYTLHNLILDGH